MVDAAILDGDWVAVRQQPIAENGEIVVAMIDNEVTVKTLCQAKGRIWLMPQNPVYPADPRREGHHSWQGGCCATPPVTGDGCQISFIGSLS